jgi:hypothetical protein
LDKWGHVLSLFPSHQALEKFDKRFNSAFKEGQQLYKKLSMFQAWFNLNAQINHLINTLGLVMGCTDCREWPITVASSSTPNVRPSDCSETSSINQQDSDGQQSTSVPPSPQTVHRRPLQKTASSSARTAPLTENSPLLDFYDRYVSKPFADRCRRLCFSRLGILTIS